MGFALEAKTAAEFLVLLGKHLEEVPLHRDLCGAVERSLAGVSVNLPGPLLRLILDYAKA